MEEKSFSFTYRVPWSDADPAGIVYFSRFFEYFETVEFAFYQLLGEDVRQLLDEQGIWLPRVEARCRYIRPIRWGDLIDIRFQVIKLTSRSATYAFRFSHHQETELLAEGRMTVVCIDQKTFRARPFPPPLYEHLRAWLQSGES